MTYKKIIFIGNLINSKHMIGKLYQNKNYIISGIISKDNSNYNTDHYSLKNFAKIKKINYLNFNKNKKNELLKFCKKIRPDIIFCIGWSHLLTEKLIKIPKICCIGFHPSKLPMNRGRHPIIWSIILGLNTTASTFFIITNETDKGKIISQKKININNNETSTSLYKKILKISIKQFQKLLLDLSKINNNRELNFILKKKNKNSMNGNILRKRKFNDGVIDWRMNSASIIRLVNALKWPYPNSSFFYNGRYIEIKDCNIEKKYKKNFILNIEPGKIIKKLKKSFHIKCDDKILKVKIFDKDNIDFKNLNYL